MSHSSKQRIKEKCAMVLLSALRFLHRYSVFASCFSTLSLLRGYLEVQVFIHMKPAMLK